jgi:hypothetical protein
MLIECPECKREVSDQAVSCPHCGHPLKASTQEVPHAPVKQRNAPIFLVLSAIALVLTLNTPRLLLFFPLMGTLGCAAISLFRKEKGWPGALIVLLLGIGLWALSEMPSTVSTSGLTSANLDAAEIVDFNWRKDPNFGTRGTIKWNVQVRNKSSQNISAAKVEFTTYDGAGKLVATTFTYVSAIPAGQTRATESYADLYGTERRANAVVADVRFAR